MDFKELKQRVWRANLMLTEYKLVVFTWGNVSEREGDFVAIKPSGVEYSELTADDIVITDLDGNIVDGALRPSSDLDTHLEIYRNFAKIGGVTHTHSKWATTWAQAKQAIPAQGTTHADYFYGGVPVTRILTNEEIAGEYELNTGRVIVETFAAMNPAATPAVLVASHGPFTWGKDAADSVHNSVVLEFVAEMALFTKMLGNEEPMQSKLMDKHYFRKHGDGAYYGQK